MEQYRVLAHKEPRRSELQALYNSFTLVAQPLGNVVVMSVPSPWSIGHRLSWAARRSVTIGQRQQMEGACLG
jgi:hypothetical protein